MAAYPRILVSGYPRRTPFEPAAEPVHADGLGPRPLTRLHKPFSSRELSVAINAGLHPS